jgi:hypothetical protein
MSIGVVNVSSKSYDWDEVGLGDRSMSISAETRGNSWKVGYARMVSLASA